MAVLPPPRVNQVRYHGVLAPHAKDRDKIVPATEQAEEEVTDDNEDQGNKSIYVDVQYGAPDCLWEDAKEQIDK